MTDRDLAEWAADIAAKPYGDRVYNITAATMRQTIFRWLDIRTDGVEHLQVAPPVLIAPVHRSNLDSLIVGTLGGRRLPTLAKESLFKIKPVGWWIAGLGAIPLDRDAADREATRLARDVLESDRPLMIFPEGTRQTGHDIGELFDGTTWIAQKAGAAIVPVGISGTEAAMPPGARFPKRVKVGVVATEPMVLPEGRVSRSALGELTADLRARLQTANDRARDLI